MNTNNFIPLMLDTKVIGSVSDLCIRILYWQPHKWQRMALIGQILEQNTEALLHK